MTSEATVVASNTSSLSVRELAINVNRVDQFVGLHFFNPVPVMPLVEVIKATETSERTVGKMTEFVKSLDKTPIVCKVVP